MSDYFAGVYECSSELQLDAKIGKIFSFNLRILSFEITVLVNFHIITFNSLVPSDDEVNVFPDGFRSMSGRIAFLSLAPFVRMSFTFSPSTFEQEKFLHKRIV